MSFTLVTGGAKNLGREICITLAKKGFNIAIHYHKSKDEALKLAEECHTFGVLAEVICGDFSSMECLKQFIKDYKAKFSSTKNLVNNVGNYLVKKPQDTSVEEMSDLFQTNLFAPFLLMQTLFPQLTHNQGSVINIGVAGIDQIKAESYATAYSLTKSNLLMLTKSFAKEFAPSNVTCNMVSPGILENSFDAPKDSSLLPMKRLGTFQEVADIVAFLLSPENHYITGQNIEVAGGVRL